MFDEVCRICEFAYGRDRCAACGRVYCEDCAGRCIEKECQEHVCCECVQAITLEDDPGDYELYCPAHAKMERDRRREVTA